MVRCGAKALIVVVASVSLSTLEGLAAYPEAPGFKSTEQMVPMRDGVKLHTLIFSPARRQGPLPILFLRTPYGIDGKAATLQSSLKELADDGYIFAFQDLRGKFKSEGTFVMQRPPRDPANPKSIDEGTDAYDSIDWLIKKCRPA